MDKQPQKTRKYKYIGLTKPNNQPIDNKLSAFGSTLYKAFGEENPNKRAREQRGDSKSLGKQRKVPPQIKPKAPSKLTENEQVKVQGLPKKKRKNSESQAPNFTLYKNSWLQKKTVQVMGQVRSQQKQQQVWQEIAVNQLPRNWKQLQLVIVPTVNQIVPASVISQQFGSKKTTFDERVQTQELQKQDSHAQNSGLVVTTNLQIVPYEIFQQGFLHGSTSIVNKLTQDGLVGKPIIFQGNVNITPLQVYQILKPVQVPVQKIIHVPVEKIVHVPVEKIVQVPVEKIVQVPVEKIVQVPVEKIVQVPVETIVERLVQVPVMQIVQVQVPVPQQPETIYVNRDVPVPVPYYIDRPIILPVSMPIYIDRPVDRPIYIDRPVQIERPSEDDRNRLKQLERINYQSRMEVKYLNQDMSIMKQQYRKLANKRPYVEIPHLIQVQRVVTKTVQKQVIVNVPIQKIVQIPKQTYIYIPTAPIIKQIQVIRQIEIVKWKIITNVEYIDRLVEKYIYIPFMIQRDKVVHITEQKLIAVPVEKLVQEEIPIKIQKPVQQIIQIEKVIYVPIKQVVRLSVYNFNIFHPDQLVFNRISTNPTVSKAKQMALQAIINLPLQYIRRIIQIIYTKLNAGIQKSLFQELIERFLIEQYFEMPIQIVQRQIQSYVESKKDKQIHVNQILLQDESQTAQFSGPPGFILQYGEFILDINQKDGLYWIGLRNITHDYYTKQCVYLPRKALTELQVIGKYVLKLPLTRKNTKIIQIFNERKTAVIVDTYKGKQYFGVRMLSYYRGEQQMSKNGFNLRRQQFKFLIDFLSS